MKIVVFGVTYWNDERQARGQKDDLYEWRDRINKFLDYPKTFLTAGSYSDPKLNPTSIPLIQIKTHITRFPSVPYNYWRSGLMTGFYHSLINEDFDILIHCQDNVLLGKNLINELFYFYNNNYEIMSPKVLNFMGSNIETGFMALKRDAVLKYVNSGKRQSLEENQWLNVEQEATELFSESWFNPFTDVTSIRKTALIDNKHPEISSRYNLSIEKFLSLPMILTSKCSPKEKILWMESNPCQ